MTREWRSENDPKRDGKLEIARENQHPKRATEKHNGAGFGIKRM
jgi:hypothetical protein